MPADNSLRLEDRNGVQDARCNSIQADEDQTIEITEDRALGRDFAVPEPSDRICDRHTYRERAGQCLALAERAQHDNDKATWLALAGKWRRLAEELGSTRPAGATTAATGRIEAVPLVSTV